MKLKRAGLLSKIVIMALVLYATISLITLNSRTEEARQTQAQLENQVYELQQENAGMQYEIEHSTDPDVIEDVARDKLGLVKPGEKIFIDASN